MRRGHAILIPVDGAVAVNPPILLILLPSQAQLDVGKGFSFLVLKVCLPEFTERNMAEPTIERSVRGESLTRSSVILGPRCIVQRTMGGQKHRVREAMLKITTRMRWLEPHRLVSNYANVRSA